MRDHLLARLQPIATCAAAPQSPGTFRTTLAMGVAALVLAACGGGSDDPAPPPSSPLAAPANFTVYSLGAFTWTGTPGATRYELYVDPDGAGPMAETKADDYSQTTGTGFRYQQIGDNGYSGGLSMAASSNLATKVNSTYRLRACDANGCGSFTTNKAYDIVNDVSHEFSSGRVPFRFSDGTDFNPRLSRDGLTLALHTGGTGNDSAVAVLARSGSTQPWEQQALLRGDKSSLAMTLALSSNGNTLAIKGTDSTSDTNTQGTVVRLYQRNGSTWTEQAVLTAPSAPSTCPVQCSAAIDEHLALSADGNVLAASVTYSGSVGAASLNLSGVATYSRTGATWAPQALLETGLGFVTSLALSNDGKTLAVNEGHINPLHDQPLMTTTTPFVRVYARQDSNTWTQQARLPAGIVRIIDLTGLRNSALALSDDGSRLAVHARSVPGHQTPELDIKASDLSCGNLAQDAWYIGLYTRAGNTWQRQTAISRGLSGDWALASDGNALLYGGGLFTRASGAWTCP